jgi:predicted phage terminase large subunit-like protein
MNKDRREKFRAWVFRAALQAKSQRGKVRVHGTILHDDSWLSRIRKSALAAQRRGEPPTWQHLFFKAHRAFDDFSGMLWPERWTEAKLRERRQAFVDDGDAPGYSQEYLNEPADTANPFLRKDDFLPMEDCHREAEKLFYVGVDFAISTKDHANRTSFTIGGKSADRLVHIVDQRVDRWSADRIIDEFFLIDKAWQKPTFFVEDGQIWKALAPILNAAMRKRERYLLIFPRTPTTDKASRARAFQAAHRAHAMRFEKEASWYPGYEEELMKFRVEAEATLDDQFDSTAILMLGLEHLDTDVEGDDFQSAEEREWEEISQRYLRAPSLGEESGYSVSRAHF